MFTIFAANIQSIVRLISNEPAIQSVHRPWKRTLGLFYFFTILDKENSVSLSLSFTPCFSLFSGIINYERVEKEKETRRPIKRRCCFPLSSCHFFSSRPLPARLWLAFEMEIFSLITLYRDWVISKRSTFLLSFLYRCFTKKNTSIPSKIVLKHPSWI